MSARKHTPWRRATSLVLAYVFTLTSGAPYALAAMPPAPLAAPAVHVPVPRPERPLAWPSPPASTAPLETKAHRMPPTLAASVPMAAALPASEATLLDVSSPLAAAIDTPAEGGGTTTGGAVGVFGPRKYVRTKGAKNEYTDTVAVPAWVVSPFTLHIQNGEPNGTYRVSSAWIEVNGTQAAAAPADFNQNVASLDRAVTLTPETSLHVTLASKPTSYLILSLSGTSADHTPPVLAWAAPAPGSVVNDATPRLLVRYQDAVGSGEPAASGVDTATLEVRLDGVDRTSLFTKRSDEASAELPETLALAEGPHTLVATIQDVAGNRSEARTDFQVDLTPPAIAVLEPPDGAYLANPTPAVKVSYQDTVGVDLASLRIFIDGTDRTSLFTKGASEAIATLDAPLPTGANQVVAKIKDLAGNEGTATTSFHVDTAPPTLTIGQPAEGSRHGSADVEVIVQYADDQALDLQSFRATLDGNPVSLSQGPEGAMGIVTGLADGADHVVSVGISDKAGNSSTASSHFGVDTTAPAMRVIQPPPGFILATSTPHVLVEYSDAQGVNLGSFQLLVNGAPATEACQVGEGAADCTIPALPEGENQVVAEILDLTGNQGTASSTFTVDTVQPTGTMAEPGAITNNPRPTIRFTYADSGSGIVPTSVTVSIDGVDQTSLFTAGPDGATGIPAAPLSDGPHQVVLKVADRAGNLAEIPASFTVDTVAPTASFTTPPNNSFINDPTPDLRLVFADEGGVGVDTKTLRVFLKAGGDGPEHEITSDFTAVSGTEARGTVPDASALPDGTYHLRASVADLAGNAASAESSFELDTVPPTDTVESPAEGEFVPTPTPEIVVRYADNVGVNKGALKFEIDGDLTSDLAVGDAEARGRLKGPLADGRHEVTVRVVDLAGNVAAASPRHFVVDTVPPTASVTTPAEGTYTGEPQSQVHVVYADADAGAGNGIDPSFVQVRIDGADRTSEFAVTADHADATLAAPLTDGAHTVQVDVLDWAGNPGAGHSSFTVDTQPPLLGITSPPEGSYQRATPVEVSGTVYDLDPTVKVTCQGTGDPEQATVSGGGWTCGTPLAEGENTLEVAATDRLGHASSASRTLTLDTTPPQVMVLEPPDGAYTRAATLTVTGAATDATGIASVSVNGVAGSVAGSTFTVEGVPVGDGTSVTLVAEATDLAGNPGRSSPVTVKVDRTPPALAITSPSEGAYLKGPAVSVAGTVSDDSKVLVYVNETLATADAPGHFTAQVGSGDGALTIEALAHDEADNTATASVHVTVDSAPPLITFLSPARGTITKEASVHVSGTVSDASPIVSFSVAGQAVVLSGGAFSLDLALPEGTQAIAATARDAAGNTGDAGVEVIVDRTPPVLAIASPAEGAALGALPVVVEGTVQDAHMGEVSVDGVTVAPSGQSWQASFDALGQGEHTFSVVATDKAGNQTTQTRRVVVDLYPPVVTIASPASGTLTREASVLVTGTVQSLTLASFSVNGAPTPVGAGGSFAATVPLAEGDNSLRAVAAAATGKTGDASVVVTRDSTPPLVTLTAPDTLARGRSGDAVATASDNVGVAKVVLKLDGTVLGTFTAPPYTASVTVPDTAQAGDTLVVVAEATDTAGNVASVSRGIRVIGSGVVVGQVLNDTTGLPLQGATVKMITTPDAAVLEATTDATGRYSLPTGAPEAVVVASKEGMTSVERTLPVQAGVGTVPVDARLTPLGQAMAIPSDGGSLTAGSIGVAVAPGAPGNYTLTPLSAQGLPGLLPLGFAPVASFDLRTDAASAPTLTASFTGLPADALHLVEYRPSLHEWTMVAPGLVATDGALSVSLPEAGSYALALADSGDPAVTIPAPGHMLAGVPMVEIPATATSTSQVTPPTIPPTGGTALGTLALQSPTPLPSGTVVSAQVKESFTFASGEVGSEEKRLEDIVLNRPQGGSAVNVPVSPACPETSSLCATLPITPSRTFGETEITAGKVHLDILAGRESVRGKAAGSEATTVESGDVQLSIPAGALAQTAAVVLEPGPLSDFLPSGAGLTPLTELALDLSGQQLSLGAELSVAVTGGVTADDTLLLAEVQRVSDIPRLVVVALAKVVGERIVSQPYPGLPGIVEGGRYVVYRSSPVGFVSGITSSTAGPVKAVTTAAGLPFIAYAKADGSYILPALPGGVTVSAVVPRTSLVGSAPASVVAGQTAAGVNVPLAGTVTTATVSPADGSVAVPTSIQVTIDATAPMNASTVTADAVKLWKGPLAEGVSVPLRFILSGSGKSLAVIPENALEPATTYTLAVSGLADVFGGLVQVPQASFTTKDNAPPVYNTSGIVFSFPDADGLVHVSAPAGTLPPGTQVLVINSGNGFVASFTADNDGAIGKLTPAQFPATINDQLMVTITDPLGNVTTFTRSQFVDEATGKTAIGPGGGTVTSADGSGVELRIPEGALDKGVTLKISLVSAADLEALFPDQKPDLPANLAGALKIESEQKPEFKKEVKLAFPIPDFGTCTGTCTAPPAGQEGDAFYYVYRRIEGPKDAEGKPRVLYQTLDHAFVEKDAAGKASKVVTASYPFAGYDNSFGAFGFSPAGNFALEAATTAYTYLMWTYDSLAPGMPLPGVVTGRVVRTKWNPGATVPEYEPVKEAVVWAHDLAGTDLFSGKQTVASTVEDGTFTLWDRFYTGGTVTVAATLPGGTPNQPCATAPDPGVTVLCTTAYEANPADWKSSNLRFYRNIATANFTFPPVQPPPPPPAIDIKVMSDVGGKRALTNGFVVVGTPLTIGFKTQNGDVRSATINGQSYSVKVDPLKGSDPLGMDWIVDGDFTPSQLGAVTVTATALPAFGSPITVSSTFRVIAQGGSNNEPVSGPPKVVTERTVPKDKATGVPVGVFAQIVFTEPVTNVTTASVTLSEVDENGVAGPAVAIALSGIKSSGEPTPSVAPGDQVTSITIQPLAGLKFNQTYRIALSGDIHDLDRDPNGNPAPNKLEPDPTTSDFTTFGPEALTQPGSGETFGSPGIVVLGNRAYLVENAFLRGTLRVFDVSDPVSPQEVAQSPVGTVYNRPVDLAGEEGTIVVATGPANLARPSNVFVFDVSNPAGTQWVGLASLTGGVLEGAVNRIALKSGLLYAATYRKGIQVVDLAQAKQNFPPLYSLDYWKMVRDSNTDGMGFGQDAVTMTIPLKKRSGRDYTLWDLKVGDYVLGGQSQPLVLVAGEPVLVVANPQTGQVVYLGVTEDADGKLTTKLEGPTGRLVTSNVVAIGQVGTRSIAVLGGYGTLKDPQTGADIAGTDKVLAIVDLADPTNPRPLAFLPLAEVPADIVLKGDLALLGLSSSVQIVSLTDPVHPVLAGTLTGVGGRLAMGENDILLSTWRSVFGGSNALGGVRTAALAEIATIQRITPSAIVYDQGQPVSEKAISIEAAVIPGREMKSAQAEVYRNGSLIETLPAQVSGSTATATWPAKRPVDRKATYTARAVIDQGTSAELKSAVKEVPLVQTVFVDKRGQKVLAPAVSDPQPVVTLDPVTAAQVSLLGDGTRAQVTISGQVTDALADIVPEKAADITAVTVGGQSISVTRVSETPTLTRPYAFKGKFSGIVTVDIGDGPNIIQVEALNAIARSGHDSFTVNVAQAVSVSEPPLTGNFESPKFLDPYTLMAAPVRADRVDSVILARGAVSVSGTELGLIETTQASLNFVGTTPELGQASLRLDAALVENQPTVREVIEATLSATAPGLWGERLELVESAPDSGVFRSVARRLPDNQPLQVQLDRLPDPASVDTLRVKLGADPQVQPETVAETAADSHVFTGQVSGLGTVRMEVYTLDQVSGQPATLRLFLDSSQLSLSSYYLELVETSAGSLRFQTRVVILPGAQEPQPQVSVTQTTILSVENLPGSEGGLFEPVWVVAEGLRSWQAGDYGKLDADQFELTTEPAPSSATTTAGRYVRFKLPVALVRDPGAFAAANVKAAVDDPDPADPNQVRPVDHLVSHEVVSQSLRVTAHTGAPTLSKEGAVRGTRSLLTVTGRWRRDRKPTKLVIKDGVTAETKGVEAICLPPGNECLFTLKTALTVPDGINLGPHEVSIEFESGQPEPLAQRFHVEHRRLVVFAIDGLGWGPFEALSADDTVFGRLFGDGPQKQGQNIRRQALTPFTPITYGRWATIFSGALPREHRVPSNQFLNRQAATDEAGNHGGLDQCIGCAGGRHRNFTLEKPDSYNRHFQVDFVYDKLQSYLLQKEGRSGRSVVIYQQAGLGRDNATVSKNGVWIQPDTWRVLGQGLFNLAFTVRKQSSTVDQEAAREARDQVRGQDFDLMVIYLGGLDHFLHEGSSSDVVASTTSYVRDEIAPRIQEIVKECKDRFHGTTAFAVFPDHGHMAMEQQQFMDLVKRGDALAGLPTWLDMLQPNDSGYRARKTVKTSNKPLEKTGVDATVVFVPHGGIAHIYVAANAQQAATEADWRRPPSLDALQPIVNNIFSAYVKDKAVPPITDILVRVPASPETFDGSQYMVVPADSYVPDPEQNICGPKQNEACTLAAQLVPMSSLEGRWNYADPERRVGEWISENTGDIVPLANMGAKYFFDSAPLHSTHGSLGFDDALIPFAFSYPGATGSFDEDTTLAPVLGLIGQAGAPGNPIKDPTEAKAMGGFFGVQ